MIIMVDSYHAHIRSSKVLVALVRFNSFIHVMYNTQNKIMQINYEYRTKIYDEKNKTNKDFFYFYCCGILKRYFVKDKFKFIYLSNEWMYDVLTWECCSRSLTYM